MPTAVAVAVAGADVGAALGGAGEIIAATDGASGAVVPGAFHTSIASSTCTALPCHADGVAATAATTGSSPAPGAAAGPAGPVCGTYAATPGPKGSSRPTGTGAAFAKMPSMPTAGAMPAGAGCTCAACSGAGGAEAGGAAGGSGAPTGGAGCSIAVAGNGRSCTCTFARVVRSVPVARPRLGSSYGRAGSSAIGSSGMIGSIGDGLSSTCSTGGAPCGRGSSGPCSGIARFVLAKARRSGVTRGSRRRSVLPRRSTAAENSACGRISSAAIVTPSSLSASSRSEIDVPIDAGASVSPSIGAAMTGSSAWGASGGSSSTTGAADAGRENGTGGSSSVEAKSGWCGVS